MKKFEYTIEDDLNLEDLNTLAIEYYKILNELRGYKELNFKDIPNHKKYTDMLVKFAVKRYLKK